MKKALVFVVSFLVTIAVFSADYTPASEEKGVAVQTSATTNAPAATDYTPAFVGQMLIFTVSNVVYVAEGTTTSSWIQVSN